MASDNELLIRLGVDASGADKQLKAIQTELRELNKQINLVNDSTEDYNKSAEGLTKQLQLQEKASEAYGTKLKVQRQQLEEYRKALKKTEDGLDELRLMHGSNSKEVKNAEKMIESYKQKIGQLETSIETTTQEMERMNRGLNETSESLKKMKWENFANGLKAVSDKFKDLHEFSQSLARTFDPISDFMQNMFKGVVETAMDFETAMTQVGVTSQATEQEMEKLTESAIRLGEQLPISSSDAAAGLNYLALAGYTVEEQLMAIEPVAKASVAWNEDLAKVSDMATDSLSAMGLGVENLSMYLDKASNAQSNANTTAIDLMEAYIEVGASLTALNVPLDESMALLSVMANRGIKAGEAGRALNAVLINLTAGTSTSLGALEELNVATFDAEGNFRGLETILKDLNLALADCTEEQRNNYLAAIGGKQHVGDLNALLNGMNEEYSDLKVTISESTGVLDEMTETMSSTTAMTIEELKGKLESLAIEIGNRLLPVIEKIVDKIIEWVDWFSSLNVNTQDTVVQFGLLLAVAAPLLTAFSAITGTISAITGAVSGLVGWLGGSGGLVGLLGGVASQTGASTVIAGVGTAATNATASGALATLASTLGPIAAGLAAIAAIGGGAYWLYNWLEDCGNVSPSAVQGLLNTDEATQKFIDTVNGMDGTLENTADAVVNFSDIATSIWTDMVDNNIALSEEQYSTISATTEATHNAVMDELQRRRTNVPGIVRAMYAEEMALAEQKGEDAVRTLEEEIQAEIDLKQGQIDREMELENTRYEGILRQQEYGLEQRYVNDQNFQDQSLSDLTNYYQQANNIFRTGESINAEEIMARKAALSVTLQDFANGRISQDEIMYGTLRDNINASEEAEKSLIEQKRQEKLAIIEGYSDAELAMYGTTREELTNATNAYYDGEITATEEHHKSLRGILENAWANEQLFENGKYRLKQQIINDGLALSEGEYEHFYSRIETLMSENGMNETLAVQTVMEEIGEYRRTGYLEQEQDLATHNTTMATTTEEGMIEVKDATHRGIGGAIGIVEASDFGTPMANNMNEMTVAAQESQFKLPIEQNVNDAVWLVETADFYNAGKVSLGGFNNAINEIIPQSKESLEQNVTDAIWIVESADFYNPANASYGQVPQAADEKLSEANEKSTGWLETIANSINIWDLLTPTLTAGQGLIDGMTQTMTDANTEAETGVETINTTIEDAPFEDTMNTQGEKMNNSMQDAMETINTTTENGMETIDTTIDNAPLEATMESQGARMDAAQEGNMSDLASTTRSGMSEVRSALETAWNGIVAWWNAQSLRDKDVNINVKTNYSTTGTPTQYSGGTGVSPMSLRSNENFMSSFFPSDMEIPEHGLMGNPYPYDMRGVTTSIGKLDLPDLNYLSRRGESTPTYDLSSLDKKLDTLIEVLSNKENGNTTFTIEEMNVRTDQDIRNIARELDALRKIQARGRGES